MQRMENKRPRHAECGKWGEAQRQPSGSWPMHALPTFSSAVKPRLASALSPAAAPSDACTPAMGSGSSAMASGAFGGGTRAVLFLFDTGRQPSSGNSADNGETVQQQRW